MEPPHKSTRPGCGAQGALKDSSSTDVVVHAGRILSTFYHCGEGYRLDPFTMEQFGIEGWVPPDGFSAHCKIDEIIGELLFFNYSKHAPYVHYGVFGADNRIKNYVPIALPGPRLPHDMAFTQNYAILNDMPLFWDPELLARNIHAVQFHPDLKTRFAIIPRLGGPDDIRWFEAEPTYVLHWINAYEDGDGRYGSEAPFVPRIGASQEDDGYIITYITDVNRDRSECVIYDARDLAAGPVCTIMMPERICAGTHGTWVSGDAIGMGENGVLAAA